MIIHLIVSFDNLLLTALCGALCINGVRGTFVEDKVTCPECKKRLAERTVRDQQRDV